MRLGVDGGILPPLMFEFSLAILTVDRNPEVDLGGDMKPFMAEGLELEMWSNTSASHTPMHVKKKNSSS